jgi:hypothetical protein
MNKRRSTYLAIALISAFVATDASAITCKSYTRCAQAVKNWCEGIHPRADGDGDGIPCENVCKSLKEVRQIKQSIGCRLR